jgi:hypothetical protein
LIALLADPDWLDEATKTIGQFWKQKNAWRHGFSLENRADDKTADAANLAEKRGEKILP